MLRRPMPMHGLVSESLLDRRIRFTHTLIRIHIPTTIPTTIILTPTVIPTTADFGAADITAGIVVATIGAADTTGAAGPIAVVDTTGAAAGIAAAADFMAAVDTAGAVVMGEDVAGKQSAKVVD